MLGGFACGPEGSKGADSFGTTTTGAPGAAVADALAECEPLYQALADPRCGGGLRPPDEDSRVKARFVQSCRDAVTLPHSGLTAHVMSDCIAAAQSDGCDVDPTTQIRCNPPGSLPGGSRCMASVQCQSGTCLSGLSPIGYSGSHACGVCSEVVPNGGPCTSAETCGPGAACAYPLTCVAITSGAAGAPCDDTAKFCAAGLYCTPDGTCGPLGHQGNGCVASIDTSTLCAPPLYCSVPSGNSNGTCQTPGAGGAFCQGDAECSAGLACSVDSTCAPVVWVSPGQPCDADLARCLVGACVVDDSTGKPTHCPRLIPDGQPCNPNDQTAICDVYSSCIDGTCLLANSAACL